MKLVHLFLISALFSLAGSSCSNTQAGPKDSTGGQHTRYSTRVNDLLIKNDVLQAQVEVDEKGVSMYASAAMRDSGKAEITVYWDEAKQYVDMVKGLPVEQALEMYLAKGTKAFDSATKAGIPKLDRTRPIAGDAELPLKGWRIALDPGHVGGSMDFAFLEKKFVRIKRGDRPEVKEEIAFNEGNLVLGTALLLRDSLEKLGAEVLMTREREGHTAFGVDFEAWLRMEYDKAEAEGKVDWAEFKGRSPEGYPMRQLRAACWNYVLANDIHGKDSTWWMSEPSTRDVFRIPFSKADLKERARVINAWRPDLTLIIHYNIWEKNTWDKGKYLHAIDDNYAMAFIPGSFMKGELRKAEDRMAFLSKLLSEDLPASERLSSAVVQGFEKHLSIPAMVWDDSLKYLRRASLRTESKGVFARNLGLTRMIHGPMCFGEALYQDNVEECMRLNRKDYVLDGMESYVPRRIEDAVDAYVMGVLKYAEGE